MNWDRIIKGVVGLVLSVVLLSALQIPAPWEETQPWGVESNAPGPEDPVDPLTGKVQMDGEPGPAHEAKEGLARLNAAMRANERRNERESE